MQDSQFQIHDLLQRENVEESEDWQQIVEDDEIWWLAQHADAIAEKSNHQAYVQS